MHKKVLIYASLLAALCACRKEDASFGIGEMPITFAPASFCLETKAGETVSFPSTSDMGVFAWKSNAEWSTSPDLVSHLNNIQFTHNSSVWVSTPAHNWPSSSSKLHFLCYSPFNSTPTISWSKTDGLKITEYTSDGTTDLCYSDFTLNQSRTDSDGTPATVLMHHALSKISFAADLKYGKSDVGMEIDDVALNIISIELAGLKNTGNFSATTLGTDGKWTDAAWASQSGSTGKTFETPGETASLIVMPQTLAAGTQKITVIYTTTIKYTSNPTNPVTSGEITETRDLMCTSCTAWEAGNHYVYTLKLDAFGSELTFAPTAADWATGDENIVKIGYQDGTL